MDMHQDVETEVGELYCHKNFLVNVQKPNCIWVFLEPAQRRQKKLRRAGHTYLWSVFSVPTNHEA